MLKRVIRWSNIALMFLLLSFSYFPTLASLKVSADELTLPTVTSESETSSSSSSSSVSSDSSSSSSSEFSFSSSSESSSSSDSSSSSSSVSSESSSTSSSSDSSSSSSESSYSSSSQGSSSSESSSSSDVLSYEVSVSSSSSSDSSSSVSSSSSSSSEGYVQPVENFSLEESNGAVTVRWPEVEGALGYVIYFTPGYTEPVEQNVEGCPSTGSNPINTCEYKIDNLVNSIRYYFEIRAYNDSGMSDFSGKIKTATPFCIVIDDNAQLDQEGSEVGTFTATTNEGETVTTWSSPRGTAQNTSNDLFNAVGEDSYSATAYPLDTIKGEWQTGQNLFGFYDVFVNYLVYDSNSDSVKYIVNGLPVQGSNSEIYVNQKLNSYFDTAEDGTESDWRYLGTYFFNNQQGKVSVTAENLLPSGELAPLFNGNVQMDAVAFERSSGAIVKKDVVNADGSDSTAEDTFNIHIKRARIKGKGEDDSSPSSKFKWGLINGQISDSAADPKIFYVRLYPGLYNINEDDSTGFMNQGCVQQNADEYEVNTNSFYVGWGSITNVTCTNVKNEAPTVAINPNPGLVTTRQAITLTANILGGNAPVNVVEWFGDFPGCSGNAMSVVTPSTPGVYTCNVKVQDSYPYDNPDTAIASITVTVKDYPPVIIVGDINPTTTPIPTPMILAAQTTKVNGLDSQVCNLRYEVSGNIYIDSNKNGIADSNEERLKDFEVSIVLKKPTVASYPDGKDELVIRKVKTDSNGVWRVNLCPGEYYVRIDSASLPKDTVASVGEIKVQIIKDALGKIDFAILPVGQIEFNFLLCLIPLIILLLVILMYAFYRYQKGREK